MTKQIANIVSKVGKLDIVLESLQKSKEVFIVESWDNQKNDILRVYREKQAARVRGIIKSRREENLRRWQSHFDDAFEQYQKGGPAPEGFLYEIAILQRGKSTGKWAPCRIDFKHPDNKYDVTG